MTFRLGATGVAIFSAALLASGPADALDPPHDDSNTIDCMNCHTPHGAPGASITRVQGNPNLCMSCHVPGGLATNRPFNDADQAVPGVSGTSHRWDSGPSGYVLPADSNTSTGSVRSGGAFTGRIEKTYTVTIVGEGDGGVASFDWSDNEGNVGSGVSGDNVPLADGLVLGFTDGEVSPAFALGDSWLLRARTDLRLPDIDDPFERPMAQRIADLTRNPDRTFDFTFGKVVCSVCHDQHGQDEQPFDPAAPPYMGSGTGEGRHFQRRPNDRNQMCTVCHEPRDVQSSVDGSHPVGVTIPNGDFQLPTSLPLDPGQEVVCMTCHSPHFTDSGGANGGLGDGYLLRDAIDQICLECHTLADDVSGSHFSATSGALWPGGQYGSSFPAHDASLQGACVNCHWPHGWPDDEQMVVDFSRLWVERYDTRDDGTDPDDAEDLCYTCHDGDPAVTDIRAEFQKGTTGGEVFRHPVADSEQTAGRSVECVDCHNPHQARADNRLAGVGGVDLDGNAIVLGAGPDDTEQAFLCYKCHGDTFNSTRPRTSNKRLDFNTSAANSGYHPVSQAGRGQSANLTAQLLGGLTTSSTLRCTDCHNTDAATDDGPVDDSPALTFGPHGSNNGTILRGNFNTDYTAQGWNANDAEFCFLCHDQNRLLSHEFDEGARTNFFQNNGRDNLHEYHLSDKGVTRSCLSCHFDIHSNRAASNTQYRWRVGGQWFTSTTPPANVKTHLVNFAPDVQANNFSMPRWQINTETGQRSCDVDCHGERMDGENYRPPSGDETSHTY